MVTTEIKFERLMDKLDEYREEISDLGAEINSIFDEGKEEELHDYILELEELIEYYYSRIIEISEELDVSEEALDIHFCSCITNRFEIYAQMKGAEITTIRKILK